MGIREAVLREKQLCWYLDILHANALISNLQQLELWWKFQENLNFRSKFASLERQQIKKNVLLNSANVKPHLQLHELNWIKCGGWRLLCQDFAYVHYIMSQVIAERLTFGKILVTCCVRSMHNELHQRFQPCWNGCGDNFLSLNMSKCHRFPLLTAALITSNDFPYFYSLISRILMSLILSSIFFSGPTLKKKVKPWSGLFQFLIFWKDLWSLPRVYSVYWASALYVCSHCGKLAAWIICRTSC